MEFIWSTSHYIFHKNHTTQLYFGNTATQLPSNSTTTKWPIIASKRHTYRKFYITQQPTEPVSHVLNNPDTEPGSPYFYLLDSYESSDPMYSKQIRHIRKKFQSKRRTNNHIEKCARITNKPLKTAKNS